MVQVGVGQNHGIDLIQGIDFRHIKKRRGGIVRPDVYAAVYDDPGFWSRKEHT